MNVIYPGDKPDVESGKLVPVGDALGEHIRYV